jgi:hypothetical protein
VRVANLYNRPDPAESALTPMPEIGAQKGRCGEGPSMENHSIYLGFSGFSGVVAGAGRACFRRLFDHAS